VSGKDAVSGADAEAVQVYSVNSFSHFELSSCCHRDEPVRQCLYGGTKMPEEMRNPTRL